MNTCSQSNSISPFIDGCVNNVLLQTARHQQGATMPLQHNDAIKLIPVLLKPQTA